MTRSRYDLTAIREDYILRFVSAAYYNVMLARKNLEIADTNLERLTKYRDAAEKRLKVGEVTRTVLLRAEGELSGAMSDQLQVKNGLELAMAVLASNVGIKGDFSLYEAPMAESDIPPLEFFRDQAFAARADLKSLETQKKIAADQIRYAEGAYWPTVSLSGVYAGTDQYPSTGNLVRDSFYAGIGLNFPLFEGGLRKADVSEAKARERQAALQYEDLKKGIDIEVQEHLPGSGHPEGDPQVSQRSTGLCPRQLSVLWPDSSNSVCRTASTLWTPTPSWCRRSGRRRWRLTITSTPSW